FNTSSPRFIGQAAAPTSVEQGDVRVGIDLATESLAAKLGAEKLSWERFLAVSSAAGGLRMTVHGLVYEMTVRAAREAALGAGAIIHFVSTGRLSQGDLKKILHIHPNIILISGGVDHGERETALYNSRKICELLAEQQLSIPVIYAGNVANQDEVREIFEEQGKKLYLVENVYPRIDELRIEETRRVIQRVFEEHITGGPGMARLRERVDGSIIPTPGGVMEAAKLLREEIGDLLVIDVGGATTDVHSVSPGSEEVSRVLISPEPLAKRSVEGGLGTYVNRKNVLQGRALERAAELLGCSVEELESRLELLPPIPQQPREIELAEILTESAAAQALSRHVGRYRSIYGPEGKKELAEGKDLSAVRYAIATGGALTRLPNREKILRKALDSLPANSLAPPKNVELLFDRDYIMAVAGVLATEYPAEALQLLKESLWADRR
ncbi:MAG TPA: DNA mismatch repair protein MutL, partial [Sediminispirochaeta sp.]|nr:DNA mismatch repair protein MutL [Sediminispirochaeta sp.]